MADHEEVKGGESLVDKIADKNHGIGSSSSSDSDDDRHAEKAKVYRLFGRERPVHKVFGGGKPADVFLWRNKKVSAGALGVVTVPPRIPEVSIPEEPVLQFASALRLEINQAFAVLRDIASGKDLKKFLLVIAGLWLLSIVGNWCNFLTLFYIVFVVLHTVPVLYEKYEDKVDPFAERATGELKKQYAVFDAKVLSKIPRGPLKDKKKAA
ncbi:hypothetical protein BT93_I1257 [Corymbia citriodora subsp. variegata]|nr:hypothetical protein BT93_I1257 [Corymbia citriodora subsp. variegata]